MHEPKPVGPPASPTPNDGQLRSLGPSAANVLMRHPISPGSKISRSGSDVHMMAPEGVGSSQRAADGGATSTWPHRYAARQSRPSRQRSSHAEFAANKLARSLGKYSLPISPEGGGGARLDFVRERHRSLVLGRPCEVSGSRCLIPQLKA